jgi:predicted nucleic acid-binding protein
MGQIVAVDHEVAIRWGILSGRPEQQGRPLSVLDGLLAATALVAGCTLVTCNTPYLHSRFDLPQVSRLADEDHLVAKGEKEIVAP